MFLDPNKIWNPYYKQWDKNQYESKNEKKNDIKWYTYNEKNVYIDRQKYLSKNNEEDVLFSRYIYTGYGISFFEKLKTLIKISRNTFKVCLFQSGKKEH